MDERVAQLIRQGQAAAQSGNAEMARSYLQAAVDLEPDNATGWLWLAGVLEDPVAARHALARVLELDPGNVRAQQGLAHLDERLAAQRPATPPDQPRGARGTGSLSPTTGPLTIEQELRSTLREEPPITPVVGSSLAPQELRATLLDGEAAGRRGSRSLSLAGSDMPYRVAVATLTTLLLVGILCFVLTALQVGPFA